MCMQLIKLVGQERAHGGTRITFLAGGRALHALGSSLAREACLNKVSAKLLHSQWQGDHVGMPPALKHVQSLRQPQLQALYSLKCRDYVVTCSISAFDSASA